MGRGEGVIDSCHLATLLDPSSANPLNGILIIRLNQNAFFDSLGGRLAEFCELDMCCPEVRLPYKMAPILEAVLAFHWLPKKSLTELGAVLKSSAFEGFGEPNGRVEIATGVDLEGGAFSHQQRQVGYQTALRDGSQVVFLEEGAFIFIQRAPYDRWERFSERALTLLAPTVSMLGITEFSRVGLRFVNRIDIPTNGAAGINTDAYVKVKFDGPRHDKGEIEEFQMRVVKPSEKKGLAYALVLATTPSPLADHSAILLDIDVFTRQPLPAAGEELLAMLGEMRLEKNDIFESCLTDQARKLFGGVEE